MKPKRFAFICHGIFDEKVGNGLARALVGLGHYCALLSPKAKTKENLQSFDVIFEPQHGRAEAIPTDSVYISWVFDWYGASDPDYTTLRDRDLLYCLGEPSILGVPHFPQSRGSLSVAVEDYLLNRPPIEPTLDLSLAGTIPPPSWFYLPTLMPPTHRFNILSEINTLVMDNTVVEPLAGTFDQVREFERYKHLLAELIAKKGWQFDSTWIEEMHSYGARLVWQCARLRNRGTLAQLAVAVSENIEFRGIHWDLIKLTARFAREFSADTEVLYNLYQRSRINLHDNIVGFAMHWRVLEAIAVGGFVMAHGSPHIGRPGQMTETFEPYRHFGEYSALNFVEMARYWLADNEARNKAIAASREVIRDKHLWVHRAQQILNDLAR